MKKDLFIAGGKILLVMAGVSALLIIPTSVLESQHSICIFKNIFGIECPGCGMTRAVSSVFHGNFSMAFHYNRLVVVVFPLLACVSIGSVINEIRRIRSLVRMREKEMLNVL